MNDLQRRAHDFDVFGVERVLYGNYELRDYRVDLVAAIRQQILHALAREGFVRMLSLREAVEEQRQVEAVVELINVDCPADFVAADQVFHLDGQVASVVVHAERRGGLREVVAVDDD